jgi:hypothetical protein
MKTAATALFSNTMPPEPLTTLVPRSHRGRSS